MKSLLLLVCCLGVMAEIRATHVVGTSQDPALFSHLPDESNFQASGGAAMGSFGGFTRVIVLLVVLLGVVYHGFVPAVLLGVEPRPAAVSLPVRKLSDQRDESVPVPNTFTALVESSVSEPKVTISPEIHTEVTQKISKQAAKKLAKKAAKKLVEAAKVTEEKKAAVQEVAAKVTEEKKAAVQEVVVVEKKRKNKENKIVVAPKKEEVEDVQEAGTVGVEKLESTQDNIFTISLQVEQVQEKFELMEEVQTAPQDQEQQEQEKDNVSVGHIKPAEEAREEELNKGWVLNSARARERTSVTIKRVKRGLNAEQLLSERQNRASVGLQNDLDYDSFVVDPRTVNCPEFMKLAAAPIVVEDASPLEIAEQETPASIQPVRDKLVSPLLVPEFIPMDHGSEPAPPQVEDAGSYFNSHKKTAWVQRQSRSVWPSDMLPGLAQMVQLPWSPIRTPCKFAAGCKKPGCQFTHPANAVPAWVSVPVF